MRSQNGALPLRRVMAGPRAESFPAQSLDVAVRGPQHLRLRVLGDDPVPPGPVDAVEPERLDRAADPLHLTGRERDQIRIAVHEADPVAVGHDLDDVAGEKRALAARAGSPHADGPAGEVAAEPNQLVAVGYAPA